MVSEDQLSLAIGKRGQNARLTAKLTGWQVDIEQEENTELDFDQKVALAVKTVAAIPGISEDQANTLVHAGFLNLEDLMQAEESDLADIDGIAEQAAEILTAIRAESEKRAQQNNGDKAA